VILCLRLRWRSRTEAHFLGHDQIGRAIAVKIGGNQSAGAASRTLSSPSAWLTSSKLPSPRLRKTFSRGPAFVSTIAARSIQPSLSMSTGVRPHRALLQ